jgi:hypothetical protein
MSRYEKIRDLREQAQDIYESVRLANESGLTPDEEYLKLCEKKYWNKKINETTIRNRRRTHSNS